MIAFARKNIFVNVPSSMFSYKNYRYLEPDIFKYFFKIFGTPHTYPHLKKKNQEIILKDEIYSF